MDGVRCIGGEGLYEVALSAGAERASERASWASEFHDPTTPTSLCPSSAEAVGIGQMGIPHFFWNCEAQPHVLSWRGMS